MQDEMFVNDSGDALQEALSSSFGSVPEARFEYETHTQSPSSAFDTDVKRWVKCHVQENRPAAQFALPDYISSPEETTQYSRDAQDLLLTTLGRAFDSSLLPRASKVIEPVRKSSYVFTPPKKLESSKPHHNVSDDPKDILLNAFLNAFGSSTSLPTMSGRAEENMLKDAPSDDFSGKSDQAHSEARDRPETKVQEEDLLRNALSGAFGVESSINAQVVTQETGFETDLLASALSDSFSLPAASSNGSGLNYDVGPPKTILEFPQSPPPQVPSHEAKSQSSTFPNDNKWKNEYDELVDSWRADSARDTSTSPLPVTLLPRGLNTYSKKTSGVSNMASNTFPEHHQRHRKDEHHRGEQTREVSATRSAFDSNLTTRSRLNAIISSLAINMFLPFVNGIMLGLGEIFAKEFVFGWLGWKSNGSVAANLGFGASKKKKI